MIFNTQWGLVERKGGCPAKRGGQPPFLFFQAHFAVAKSGLALYNPSTFLREVLMISREFDRAFESSMGFVGGGLTTRDG